MAKNIKNVIKNKKEELELNRKNGFIPAEYGENTRKLIHEMSLILYEPKYGDGRHAAYMNKFECSFEFVGPQDLNHLEYFCMFSIPSQHVYGDTIEECLDKAIDIYKKGKYKDLY